MNRAEARKISTVARILDGLLERREVFGSKTLYSRIRRARAKLYALAGERKARTPPKDPSLCPAHGNSHPCEFCSV